MDSSRQNSQKLKEGDPGHFWNTKIIAFRSYIPTRTHCGCGQSMSTRCRMRLSIKQRTWLMGTGLCYHAKLTPFSVFDHIMPSALPLSRHHPANTPSELYPPLHDRTGRLRPLSFSQSSTSDVFFVIHPLLVIISCLSLAFIFFIMVTLPCSRQLGLSGLSTCSGYADPTSSSEDCRVDRGVPADFLLFSEFKLFGSLAGSHIFVPEDQQWRATVIVMVNVLQ